MLGKIERRRKRGRHRMRWLDGITNSMNMSLNKPRSWWWTEKSGVLQSLCRKESDTTEWLNLTELGRFHTPRENWVFLGSSNGKESTCNARDQVQTLSQEDPLKKGMATHCSVFPWRIPWTKELGGLWSMGSQRVEHNWATNTGQLSSCATTTEPVCSNYWSLHA